MYLIKVLHILTIFSVKFYYLCDYIYDVSGGKNVSVYMDFIYKKTRRRETVKEKNNNVSCSQRILLTNLQWWGKEKQKDGNNVHIPTCITIPT